MMAKLRKTLRVLVTCQGPYTLLRRRRVGGGREHNAHKGPADFYLPTTETTP